MVLLISAVPVNEMTLTLVMLSPATPLSTDCKLTVGVTGATVSTMTFMALDARARIAGGIGRRRGEIVGAVSQRVVVAKLQAPLPLAVTLPSKGRAVIDFDRCIGLRRAGQRQHIRIGDTVASAGAIRRK